MFVLLNSSGMIAVFPECPFSFLELIEFLAVRPAISCRLLGMTFRPAINDQQMDMIGSDRVVEYSQAKAFPGFKEPEKPASSVPVEFQQKFLFVATMGNVPHLSRNTMSVCSCHS